MKLIVGLAFVVCVFALAGDVIGQRGGNRGQVIESIFQSPIQTLSAVSNLAQATRRRIPQVLQQLSNSIPVQQLSTSAPFQQFSYTRPNRQSTYPKPVQQAVSSPPPEVIPFYPRSRAAKVAGLYIAADGSGFRI